MNELKIRLAQITPLIHFQVHQDGATDAILRASEVKPKLDRFLQTYSCSKGEIQENWCLPKVKDRKYQAFDYKMQIMGNGQAEEPHKSFFANMGEDSKDIKQIRYEDGVDIKIISKYGELLSLIQKHLALFFALHNFGARGSKGFGSFVVEEIDGEVQNVSTQEIANTKIFDYVYTCGYKKNPLDTIYEITGKMKTKYKERKGYLVEKYNGKTDKNLIKDVILSKNENKDDTSIEKYKFYRAMLGLADNYNITQEKIEIPVVGVKKGADDKPKIQRFQHPILFKPVKGEILILFNDLPIEMYNQEFTIGGKHIFTPSKEEFDLKKFVDAFFRDNAVFGIRFILAQSPQKRKKLFKKKKIYDNLNYLVGKMETEKAKMGQNKWKKWVQNNWPEWMQEFGISLDISSNPMDKLNALKKERDQLRVELKAEGII